MKSIDWDKVRRNRKVWKLDYREDFRREEEPVDSRPSVSHATSLNLIPTMRVFPQPLNASAIRSRLRNRGLKGNRMNKLVNAVLAGEKQLAWIEFDLELEEMRGAGFQPCPPEERGGATLLRFQRHSTNGVIVEERVYTLTKVIV